MMLRAVKADSSQLSLPHGTKSEN